jgi:hypothetical protein
MSIGSLSGWYEIGNYYKSEYDLAGVGSLGLYKLRSAANGRERKDGR